MSQIGDAICSAIDDGARDHAAIVEATGFESKQVSNHLFHLKASGAVVKGPDGLVRGDGTPMRTVHESAQPEGSPPPATRKKATKIKRRAKRRAKSAASARVAKSARTQKRKPAAVPVVATDRIASQRFGDFVVIRHRDLVELVAMLERWRLVVRND